MQVAAATALPRVADAAWAGVRALLEDGGSDRIAFERLEPLLRAQLALGDRDGAARSRQRLDAAGYRPLHPLPVGTPVAAR